ncbi:AI-2E family transporter [Lysinibacillus sp. MHQ-1]|nr:AI-2E family transporter [Lysinibacillus sp. MHQ-1]
MIALFLFMLDLPKLKRITYKYLKPNTAKKIKIILNRLKDATLGYMKAHLFVSFIIGGVTLVGLLLIQPKYAITMTIIIWLIDIVPFLGSIIILAPWGVLSPFNGKHSYCCKIIHLSCYFTHYSSCSRA